MTGGRAAAALLGASWIVPVIWVAAVLTGNRIGSGWIGFFTHFVTWPFAWCVSLFLAAASAVKWAESRDQRSVTRVAFTALAVVSALIAFPGGVYVCSLAMERFGGALGLAGSCRIDGG